MECGSAVATGFIGAFVYQGGTKSDRNPWIVLLFLMNVDDV